MLACSFGFSQLYHAYVCMEGSPNTLRGPIGLGVSVQVFRSWADYDYQFCAADSFGALLSYH